jgi:hypothetical protein
MERQLHIYVNPLIWRACFLVCMCDEVMFVALYLYYNFEKKNH